MGRGTSAYKAKFFSLLEDAANNANKEACLQCVQEALREVKANDDIEVSDEVLKAIGNEVMKKAVGLTPAVLTAVSAAIPGGITSQDLAALLAHLKWVEGDDDDEDDDD